MYLLPSQPHLKSKPWKHPPSCPAQEQNTCSFCRQCLNEEFTWGRRKSLLQIRLVFFVPGAVPSHSDHFWASSLNWPGLSHESWVIVLCSSPVNPPEILQHGISSNAPFFSRDHWHKCWNVSQLGAIPMEPQQHPVIEWGLLINDQSRTKQLWLTFLVLPSIQSLSHVVNALLILHCINIKLLFQTCAFRSVYVPALLWHWFISAYSQFSPPLFSLSSSCLYPRSIFSSPSPLQWHTHWWGWMLFALIHLYKAQALPFMPMLSLVHTTGKGKEPFVQMYVRSYCILLQVILQSSESETWELQTCVMGECC